MGRAKTTDMMSEPIDITGDYSRNKYIYIKRAYYKYTSDKSVSKVLIARAQCTIDREAFTRQDTAFQGNSTPCHTLLLVPSRVSQTKVIDSLKTNGWTPPSPSINIPRSNSAALEIS